MTNIFYAKPAKANIEGFNFKSWKNGKTPLPKLTIMTGSQVTEFEIKLVEGHALDQEFATVWAT